MKVMNNPFFFLSLFSKINYDGSLLWCLGLLVRVLREFGGRND
jgi:hypothetical protein